MGLVLKSGAGLLGEPGVLHVMIWNAVPRKKGYMFAFFIYRSRWLLLP
jgi:hypothetical protein